MTRDRRVNARIRDAAIGAQRHYHNPFGVREPLSGRLIGEAGRATRSLLAAGGGGATDEDASAVMPLTPIIE